MADMTTIKGRIAETIYPNGKGAITAESHQALLLEMVDDINSKKADKKEVTFVDEKVTILANETKSSVQNLQDELSELSERIDNLQQGEEFDAEGNYPSLHVGTADTAIDLAGRGESVPAEFGFRASGGKSIKDGRAYIKSIKGNSVVWNQLSTTTELNESKTTESLPIGASIVQGHKYAIILESSNARLYLYSKIDGSNKVISDTQDGKSWIFTSSYSATSTGSTNTGLWWFSLYLNSEITTYSIKNIRLIDITKAFPNDWQNINTIEDFNARVATLGIDLNAYNEGQVIHCNTESIKSVGDNAWDEEWELGTINSEDGRLQQDVGSWRTKNPIRVIPGATYYISGSNNNNLKGRFYTYNGEYIGYLDGKGIAIGSQRTFVAPSNAALFMFTPNVAVSDPHTSQFCIRLAHTGYKTDYEPYWQDTLPLPIIRKYFPNGMKKAGTAHDEIRFNKASGKWEYSKGRIKSVDMGSLTFSEWQDGMYAANLADMAIKGNILCAKYNTDTYTNVTAKNTGIAALTDKGGIVIYDATYTSPSAIKTALQGVILYYEAAEWEWVELDAEDQNFRDYYNVADFGTEMSQSNVPSAPFSADIIYQFNAVDMIREHEIEITELQKVIATMQAQLTSLINGGQ